MALFGVSYSDFLKLTKNVAKLYEHLQVTNDSLLKASKTTGKVIQVLKNHKEQLEKLRADVEELKRGAQ